MNRCGERAEETGMPLDVRVDCVLDGVNEMDMAIVLSNLIDNAFEAAEQAEDAHISVKITVKDGMFTTNVLMHV